MEQKGAEKQDIFPSDPTGRKPPSEGSTFRWIAFALFAIVNVLFGLAMIVLIAL